MDSFLLNPEIQEFIKLNVGVNITKLALAKNPFPETDWLEIIGQISAKTKAMEKLPTWFSNDNIIYPSKISVEQTSSERTADYKASLISGKIIDLTGGFGVDDYYFSKKAESVVHCEIDANLSSIANHNFEQLGALNIISYVGDSRETLEKLQMKFDWIYIDPSRRNDLKGKVFKLYDCLPNVPENLDFYFSFADNILIKTAPLLDISAGLLELSNVKTIHIVAVKNDVKELLFELKKDYKGPIEIKTINFSNDVELFNFQLGSENYATFSIPKKYLFEPNAAIMKSGGFEAVSEQFEIAKLHRHSHLYTADVLIDFPGRIFEILTVLPYNKSAMKQMPKKANVTTRNFSDSVETIRKKWRISEGGNIFSFFTTDINNDKIVLICGKIQQL